MDIFSNGNQIIRDNILGESIEGKRTGLLFEENGMHVYDVEVLDISILDNNIEKMLIEAQQDVMNQELKLSKEKRNFDFTKEKTIIEKALSELITETNKRKIDLQIEENSKQLELNLAKIKAEIDSQKEKYTSELEKQKLLDEANQREIERERKKNELAIEIEAQNQALEIQFLEAESKALKEKTEAISPEFIAALQAFGDKALAEKMAESMAPLAILGGQSVADIFQKLLKGTVIENILNKSNNIQ
jgi:major vault protein